MNRGVARRSVFECRRDFRCFMAGMARAVRRQEIEVHAFCLMTTHFHLLLRSVEGALPKAMDRIERGYVRRFNRERPRTTPVFRGPSRCKLVESETYRRVLFRYIHFNPVKGGAVSRPQDYEYSSASMLGPASRTRWLADFWLAADERESWESSQRGHNLRRRALQADQEMPGSTVIGPNLIARIFYDRRASGESLEINLRKKRWDGAMIAEIFMLRDLAGLHFTEIAKRMGISAGTVRRRYRDHFLALEQEFYRAEFDSLVRLALRRGLGERVLGARSPAGDSAPGSVISPP